MSNRNGRVAVAPFEEAVESPAQRIWSHRLSDVSPETRASLFSSDLQTLEHEFGRFDVSEENNCVNGYDARRSYNYDFHERSRSASVMGSPYPPFNGNLVDVPFFSSNPFFDQSPWSDAYGYMSGTRNTLLSRAKDRVESHLLQDVIAKGSKETIDKIFDNLISHVCELMIDPFGHRVFEKLMEKCTDEQITRVLDIVLQQPLQFVRLCVHSHGTRAIQDLMRSLCSVEQIARFMATLCHVALLLTKDANANLVILFCFNHFSPSHSRYLLEVIVQNCYQVAIDQHGYCMLNQCIRQSSRELRDPLIKEIISNVVRLCKNCYGNYVVQFVLDLEDCEVTSALSKHLDGNYVQLSYDKYGSHVVQKCLENREFCSRRIIAELLSDIDSLLVHPFGNYVIQTAWIVSEDHVRNVLLYHINRNVSFMRCNIYGRKLLQKLNLWT
ncbi:Pumilio RNA-binding repeat [Arabidopsis suecica]|uniref:Pumilio RNA-binding repeat n=1 Tax=Arabidopsis suecica TaxID=45249 RepID=A0A8T1ZDM8_ARASU|nr:Pumilio RNA-binding repeat [Arabidopsis suecica]